MQPFLAMALHQMPYEQPRPLDSHPQHLLQLHGQSPLRSSGPMSRKFFLNKEKHKQMNVMTLEQGWTSMAKRKKKNSPSKKILINDVKEIRKLTWRRIHKFPINQELSVIHWDSWVYRLLEDCSGAVLPDYRCNDRKPPWTDHWRQINLNKTKLPIAFRKTEGTVPEIPCD